MTPIKCLIYKSVRVDSEILLPPCIWTPVVPEEGSVIFFDNIGPMTVTSIVWVYDPVTDMHLPRLRMN